MRPREVVARVRRSSVSALEMTLGMWISAPTVRFTDGTFWVFEISRKQEVGEAFVAAAAQLEA